MIKIGPIEKLGTVWWFELFDVEEKNKARVTKHLTQVMNEFENNYSRFIPGSFIGRLNQGQVISEATTELHALLAIAEKAYEETNGVFNIAVGNYLEKIGYNPSYTFKVQKNLPEVPKQNIAQLLLEQKVMHLPEEVKIDFGGFAKGYLVDKLAKILKEELGCQYFLINGGGDMYATSENGEAIGIALHDGKNVVGKTQLFNEGFAGSSPYLRAWKNEEGVEYNHLVGKEEHKSETTSSFVKASTTYMADIYATVLAINPQAKTPNEITILNPK